ncbi:MAG: sulfur carrier protein ThiS [Thiotrichaceae bacterium]|nr:sulfur carrier protein ThiS [Thiotrichaceae bacterium]
MHITINGDSRTITDSIPLSELVKSLNLEGKRFAIEINKTLIPRSQYTKTVLNADDKIEIVGAIGGG